LPTRARPLAAARPRAAAATLLLLSGFLAGPSARAATVDLAEHVSTGEWAALASVWALDAGLIAAGWAWADQIDPAIGPPGPDSLDRRVSEAFEGGDAQPLLWGAPDLGGWVLALSPLVAYGSSAALLGARGRGWMGSSDDNPHLRLLAYGEALGVSLLLAQTAKLAVGRVRPRHALYGRSVPEDDPEAKVSFFSMHSAVSFTAASFFAMDLVARLPRPWGILAGAGLYGLAGLVAFSRIHDQAHFLSDVLLGSAVGVASGSLFYLRHFDLDGQPRGAEAGGSEALGVAASPALLSVSGTF